jgi:alkyldihydroxyacetonephosphate synthase
MPDLVGRLCLSLRNSAMAPRLKFYGWGHEGEGLDEAERARLFRFVAEKLGAEPRALALPPPASDIALRAPRISAPAALARVLTEEPYERLLHTYGKSYPETVRALGRDFANAPDFVALPRNESDIAAVLDWATATKVAVIPFGAGSSVVGGVEPVVGEAYAGAVSLDMRRLNRVLEVDAASRAARIQAGILGPAIEAALKPHGFALRHYPQSFEFSTLGGWIATRSGGHFATLYTHIDDFVESLRTVTPAGVMESRRLPGSGAGPSPDRMMIGSEGALGIITEAWMRLQGRPRFRADAVFGFPDFFAAARAVRAVSQAGLYPSNLRVIDNDEAGAYGVNAYEESLLVLAFESADHPVDAWMARAIELMQDSGGRRHADEAAASRWRTAFIRMPYGRELTVPMGVINDTFETAITWERFEPFHEALRKATEEALKEATGRKGTVSTRFTHVYPDGPAVYYTFSVRGDSTRLIEQWRHVKTRASDALIAAGGTITHHHAVGRDHMPWYRAQRPDLFGKAFAAAKRALDPAGIMNPGVLAP